MRILELSALPVWPLEGKGGMPSLRETLRGHVRGGHEVVLLLPAYQLFEDRPKRVTVREDEGYSVNVVPCRWAPALMAARRLARWVSGGKEPLYPLRWMLNAAMCALLTCSLFFAALRVRRREKQSFQLVYAHNQYAALSGWLLARWWGVPNVTRLYGTFLADLMKKPLVALRYPVAAAGYLVPSSLLICANDGTRGDEVARRMKIAPGRFRFWQNGVDLPETEPSETRESMAKRFAESGLRLESKWIVTCSRLSYWKRIDRMIRALRVAREGGADCQLVIAGDGAERKRLQKLACELGVERDVVWLGALAHDSIWELMHVGDVFAITNDVTNRCNPLYEAICAGLPIVSVTDPSTADLLTHGENALLADKDDTEALGEHLAAVCSDVELAASLAAAQAERRERLWSWERRMDVEVAELEKLVSTRPSTCATIA